MAPAGLSGYRNGPLTFCPGRDDSILAGLDLSGRLFRCVRFDHTLSHQKRPSAVGAPFARWTNCREEEDPKDYHVVCVIWIHSLAGRSGVRLSLRMVSRAA